MVPAECSGVISAVCGRDCKLSDVIKCLQIISHHSQISQRKYFPLSSCSLAARAANEPSVKLLQSRVKKPTRAFSWLKTPTSAFTFKTLLRHYAKWVLIHGKVLVSTFNQEKTLIEAFSVIVKTSPMVRLQLYKLLSKVVPGGAMFAST